MLTVYSKNNCPGCVTLKSRLDAKGVVYEVKNIDTDPDAYKFVVDRRHRSVPVVYNDQHWIEDVNSLLL